VIWRKGTLLLCGPFDAVMIHPRRRERKIDVKAGASPLNDLPINPFDGAVYLFLLIAVVAGLRAGLLRSLATIFAYLAAAPVAIIVAPYVTPFAMAQFKLQPSQTWLIFAALFLVLGFLIGILLKLAIGEIVGKDIGIADRFGGALLGAVRIGLLAVLMVLIFDRIIPAGREPAFLTGSKLRPILSKAGAVGLKTLPSDIEEYIDRLKKQRGL
jgi:membrane protein required for colicin V production